MTGLDLLRAVFHNVSMARVQIALFGPFQATRDGQPIPGLTSSKVQALLAYLALEADRPHPRKTLAALFWPENAGRKAMQNLRQSLSRLQRAFDVPDLLLHDQQTVQFNVHADVSLDAILFAEARDFTRQHHHRVLHRCRRCGSRLEKGAALYRGGFLHGLPAPGPAFEEWALLKREWFQGEAIALLSALTDRYRWQGRYDDAYRAAWRQLEIDPLREEAHRQAMRALALAGREQEAVRHFRTLRDLLRDELDVVPAAATVALLEKVQAGNVAAEVRPGPDRLATAPPLPRPQTPFLGRDEEMARIAERLDHPDCRLLTLVGPGGVGKTRLALQTAREKGAEFRQGAVFAPLAAADTAAGLLAAVAGSLGLTFPPKVQQAEARQKHLLQFLRGRELLLVLDNYEQLLPEMGLILALLEKALEVTLLITSRQPLNLRAEWLLDVPGLAYPGPEEASAAPVDQLLAYEAPHFFLRAASRQGKGDLPPGMVHALLRLCRLVDGTPLALELAAATVRDHSPELIAATVARTLDFLETTMADVPPRHRSLRAVFEHSWELLSPGQQRALSRLSCFRGGFTAHAAAEVAGADETLLDALIARSLVRGEKERYDLHELVRQFAAEKLAAQPDVEADVRDRHSSYYTTLAREQGDRLSSYQAAEAVATFRREVDNVRAAWRRAVERIDRGRLTSALPALSRFYELLSMADEGGAAMDAALAVARSEPALPWLVDLLAARAHFHNLQIAHDEALQAAREAIALAEENGWQERTAAAHLRLGEAHLRQGFHERAFPHLEKALSLARARDEPHLLIAVLRTHAAALEGRADQTGVVPNLAEALEIAQELGDPWSAARIWRHLGSIAAHDGDYEQSRDHYRKALVRFRRLGDRSGESGIYNNMGAGFLAQGRYAEAREQLAAALQLRRELGDLRAASISLINLGNLAGMQGDFGAAERYLTEALDLMRDAGNRRGEGSVLCFLGFALLCQHRHADAESVLHEAVAVTEAVASVAYTALARFRLGQMAWMRGDPGAALAVFEQALEAAREYGFSHLVLDILAELGLLYQELGREEEAIATGDEAVAEARGYDRPPAIASALTRRGQINARRGAWDAAVADHGEALKIRRTLRQDHLAVEPLAGLAAAALARGDSQQAVAHAEEIRTTTEATGLQGILHPDRIHALCRRILPPSDHFADRPGMA